MKIERGWFYLAALSPRQGTEPGKTRPVLVVQTDLLNQIGHPSTIIIPITTRIVDDAANRCVFAFLLAVRDFKSIRI